MPKVKTTMPSQSRQKGQRSLDLPLYLNRVLPQWRSPDWLTADQWRKVVAQQPIATICQETLISNLTALDWTIEPYESDKRDELRSEIRYYTRLFEGYGLDYDYVDLISWPLADALSVPFGGAVEVGRDGDDPQGRVLWLEPIDGATLFPTLNYDYPVGQSILSAPMDTIYFPRHTINRLYTTLRRDIRFSGWQIAPPEKVYLALEMLNRGDVYYANLLLDTPQVGILDLLDMSRDSAQEWLESWQKMLTGIDPFKIPVLYEHEKPATFIPFTRNPAELMFDKATLKYASLVCAGYNMTLSDIGVSIESSGGETLAGSIRQERKTRRVNAGLKRRLELFFNRLLPETLYFKFIDLDDEAAVALGRARLADATAAQILITNRVFTPNEMRQQYMADGMVNISLPETVEGGDSFPDEAQKGEQNLQSNSLGRPIAPSQGGWGETKKSTIDSVIGDTKLYQYVANGGYDDWFSPDVDTVLSELSGLVDDVSVARSLVEEMFYDFPKEVRKTILSNIDKGNVWNDNDVTKSLTDLVETMYQNLANKIKKEE